MPSTKKVFFVFNSKGVKRLAANPDLLSDIDCVISVIPGIPLEPLTTAIGRLTLEEALIEFRITQRTISELASFYSRSLFDSDSMTHALSKLGGEASEAVRLALLNHTSLLIHNAFAFELLFRALVTNGLVEARAFRTRGRYRLIERLDIRLLLDLNISFWPHLAHLCAESSVKLVGLDSGIRLPELGNAIRDYLLLGFKAKTLLQRSFFASRSKLETKTELAVVVRARTELVAAEPILRTWGTLGRQSIMLVDDLIKSPDGTSAAIASGRQWEPLHKYSRPVEICAVFWRCLLNRRRAAREGIGKQTDRLAAGGFLSLPAVAQEVLYTALASVPELLVHSVQMARALSCLTPKAVLSFDTVDRWGAVQGEIARQRGVRSVMVQNTAADDIFYPWPLAMDHLVVASDRLRSIFIASGANPARVHSFGLPLHDEVIKTGYLRLQALRARAAQNSTSLRVLVATQPFVQEFNYNMALIDDIQAADKVLNFEIEWVLKPHPREQYSHYALLKERLVADGLAVDIFNGRIEDAFAEVDLVLSRTSTSLEFAALGGVPGVAHLDRYPADIINRLDYLRSPVTEKSFDRADLVTLLQRHGPHERRQTLLSYHEKREKYLEDYFSSKGRAASKIIELIDRGACI